MLQAKEILALTDRLENIKTFMASDPGSDFAQDLQKIRERVRDDVFRVAVVGEFSSGKSTFINALLGIDLLSHAVSETTAAVTRVCHVPRNHPKLGSCEILYRSGETEVLNDIHSLAQYTTAQSDRNVVEEIRCVSFYAHILDTDQPIIIIDTPGLNGIADKHREITLEEVKSAHACIYLLSLKGVTASDKSFLLTLRNYQSCFLFVQNFTDELNTHEGENVEKKLAADRAAVESIFSPEAEGLSCYYCAVSSLQALASRDQNLRMLYHGDREVLTEEKRRQLAKSSGFAEFERCFNEIIAGGAHRRIALESARQALRAQIGRVLPEMEAQDDLHQELRGKDAKTIRIENAEKVIARIEQQREDRERRLRQFIISRDKENRKGLRDYAKEQLALLCQQTEEDIDRSIKNYDELVTFPQRRGEDPPDHYIRQLAGQINGSLIPDMNRRVEGSLCHLYEEALRQVGRYAGRIVAEGGELTIYADIGDMHFESVDESHEAKQRRMEQEARNLEREGKKHEENIRLHQNRRDELQKKAKSNRDNWEREKQKIETARRRLGRMPEVEITREPRVEYRSGFFGELLDGIFGPKSTYYVDVPDDSKQREWKKKSREYAADLARKNTDYQKKAMQLNAELRNLEDSIRVDCTLRDQKIRRSGELRARIRREEDMYQSILIKRKEEYCQLLKNRLKEAIRHLLVESDDPGSPLNQLLFRIDQTSEQNLPGIIELSLKAFRRASEQQVEELRLIQQEDAVQLDARYAMYSKDVEQLRAIQKELEKGEEN